MGQPAAPAAPAAAPHADLPRVSTFTRGDLTSAGGSGGGEGASPGSTKKGSYGASSMEGTFVAEVRWRTQCVAAAVWSSGRGEGSQHAGVPASRLAAAPCSHARVRYTALLRLNCAAARHCGVTAFVPVRAPLTLSIVQLDLSGRRAAHAPHRRAPLLLLRRQPESRQEAGAQSKCTPCSRTCVHADVTCGRADHHCSSPLLQVAKENIDLKNHKESSDYDNRSPLHLAARCATASLTVPLPLAVSARCPVSSLTPLLRQ